MIFPSAAKGMSREGGVEIKIKLPGLHDLILKGTK